jgi:hypothetical protein
VKQSTAAAFLFCFLPDTVAQTILNSLAVQGARRRRVPSAVVSAAATKKPGKRGNLPFGNGHFWPIAASLILNVALATPADSFVALGSNLTIQNSNNQLNEVLV